MSLHCYLSSIWLHTIGTLCMCSVDISFVSCLLPASGFCLFLSFPVEATHTFSDGLRVHDHWRTSLLDFSEEFNVPSSLYNEHNTHAHMQNQKPIQTIAEKLNKWDEWQAIDDHRTQQGAQCKVLSEWRGRRSCIEQFEMISLCIMQTISKCEQNNETPSNDGMHCVWCWWCWCCCFLCQRQNCKQAQSYRRWRSEKDETMRQLRMDARSRRHRHTVLYNKTLAHNGDKILCIFSFELFESGWSWWTMMRRGRRRMDSILLKNILQDGPNHIARPKHRPKENATPTYSHKLAEMRVSGAWWGEMWLGWGFSGAAIFAERPTKYILSQWWVTKMYKITSTQRQTCKHKGNAKL